MRGSGSGTGGRGVPARVRSIRGFIEKRVDDPDRYGVDETVRRYLMLRLASFGKSDHGLGRRMKVYEADWLLGLGDANRRQCAYIIWLASHPSSEFPGDTVKTLLGQAGGVAARRLGEMGSKHGMRISGAARTVEDTLRLLDGCASDSDFIMLPLDIYLSDVGVDAWIAATRTGLDSFPDRDWDEMGALMASRLDPRAYTGMSIAAHMTRMVMCAADDMLPGLDRTERVLAMAVARSLVGVMRGSRTAMDEDEVHDGGPARLVTELSHDLKRYPKGFIIESEPLLGR